MGLDEYLDLMVQKFGKDNCTYENKKLILGEKTLNGKRINVPVVGQRVVVYFLEILSNDSQSRCITF